MPLELVELHVQAEVTRGVVQCQLAANACRMLAERLDAVGDEARAGVVSGIQDAPRRGVPVLGAKAKRSEGHGHIDTRQLPLARREGERALAAGHGAQRARETGMVDRELGAGMDRVDRVAAWLF